MRPLAPLQRNGIVAAVRALVLGIVLVGPCSAAPDAVTRWTRFAIDPQRGPYPWHAIVLMHLAIHDSLNAIDPRYRRWSSPVSGEPSDPRADPVAAIAAAAHRVLSAELPGPDAALAAELRASLADVADGDAKRQGMRLGEAVAANILDARAADSSAAVYEFPVGTAPGQWRATPPFFRISTAARYQPFAFEDAEPSRIDGPPVLDSSEYVAAVDEVRAIGAQRSSVRTDAQTRAALFWARQNSQRNFHALAIRTLEAHAPDPALWESARAMALLSVALTDSLILAWRAKETYRFWRPITAIHEGSGGVPADREWRPLVETPGHPDHPSAHASDCAAGAEMLRRLFPGVTGPVDYVAIDQDGANRRSYPSFEAIADECAASRLWAGVHFSTANRVGTRLGRAIAERVFTVMLVPQRVR